VAGLALAVRRGPCGTERPAFVAGLRGDEEAGQCGEAGLYGRPVFVPGSYQPIANPSLRGSDPPISTPLAGSSITAW
jgi:hypothetical protein